MAFTYNCILLLTALLDLHIFVGGGVGCVNVWSCYQLGEIVIGVFVCSLCISTFVKCFCVVRFVLDFLCICGLLYPFLPDEDVVRVRCGDGEVIYLYVCIFSKKIQFLHSFC